MSPWACESGNAKSKLRSLSLSHAITPSRQRGHLGRQAANGLVLLQLFFQLFDFLVCNPQVVGTVEHGFVNLPEIVWLIKTLQFAF